MITALSGGIEPKVASHSLISATPKAKYHVPAGLRPYVEHDRGMEEVAGI